MDNNGPPQPGPPNNPDAPDKEAMDQVSKLQSQQNHLTDGLS
jgi:hypothetical protein